METVFLNGIESKEKERNQDEIQLQTHGMSRMTSKCLHNHCMLTAVARVADYNGGTEKMEV